MCYVLLAVLSALMLLIVGIAVMSTLEYLRVRRVDRARG